MPQSLADVLLHIVFSTKNRGPLLKTSELRERWAMEFGPFGARRPSAASRRKRGRRDGAARFTQRASVVAQPGTGDIPLPKVQP